MASKRKNVTVTRSRLVGDYFLFGINPPAVVLRRRYNLKNHYVMRISQDKWDSLGLRKLRKGQSAIIDLRVSGLPKSRKAGGRK